MSTPRNVVREKLLALPVRKGIAYEIEKGVYNATIDEADRAGIPRYWENPKFSSRYLFRARSILYNLRNPKNPGLLRKVVEGRIEPCAVAEMTAIQMFPEHWDQVVEYVTKKRNTSMFSLGSSESMPDGAFQCKKCKGWKTVYYQLQTRSADEPMTTFVTCGNCGFHWKF
jgi:transcription elongation factor S-II